MLKTASLPNVATQLAQTCCLVASGTTAEASFSLWFDGSCEVISVSCFKQVEIRWKGELHAVIALMFCWCV